MSLCPKLETKTETHGTITTKIKVLLDDITIHHGKIDDGLLLLFLLLLLLLVERDEVWILEGNVVPKTKSQEIMFIGNNRLLIVKIEHGGMLLFLGLRFFEPSKLFPHDGEAWLNLCLVVHGLRCYDYGKSRLGSVRRTGIDGGRVSGGEGDPSAWVEIKFWSGFEGRRDIRGCLMMGWNVV